MRLERRAVPHDHDAAQVLDACARARVVRGGERLVEEAERLLHAAGQPRRVRRLVQPARAVRDASVSSAARSSALAASAWPPRRETSPAACSSSAATSSSRAGTAEARCHARRSGAASLRIAPASAPCAARRCAGEAAW